ncbi:MAG: SufB/SufD family protein, partial [Vicinamibacteria bacterium]
MEAVAERTGLERALFDSYREERAAGEPRWLAEIRRSGMGRFREIGFPTVKDDSWKYTNVAPILRVPFGEPSPSRPTSVLLPRAAGIQLVFVNGRYSKQLSSNGGLQVSSLREVLTGRPERAQSHLAKIARDGNAFSALNAAFLEDGAFVRVPEGTMISEPVHLVFLSEPAFEPTVSHPRNLFVLERGSQATVVETYIGTAGETYFTNAVTEVALGEGAVLDFYKIERESEAAFHVATMEVRQARDSQFTSHSITFGGALARNDLNVVLDGEGAGCSLNGLFVGSGAQLLDNHTLIDHAKPH